ncbi:hypothetical protein TTHERM_00486240 (macronuclear) [Tetrahymena thermophila SB210]|uniref:Uncharacterized protein n=1 Tax=Tetrahymena thermophila (strain SB210) TaxID=312017 RepID=I7M6G7_TETTS|nr:hypothetical protein TTHERM_00486240 [Tetrahymena thermophila SB210]EAR85173.3 hypothetical protein TTHERM_00486240 [Tetrahymena thermophila SB210]|eukprot:XP_001032836.3 hypothetical protein TTHERM_00486240 [Tetrahymena thermophila SB210]
MIPSNGYNQGSNFVQAYVEQQKNELQNQETFELKIPKINRENKQKKQQQSEQENFKRKFDSLMKITFLNLNELVFTRLKYGFKQIKQYQNKSLLNKTEQCAKKCRQIQILINALKKYEMRVILQNACMDMPFNLEQLKYLKILEPKTLLVKVVFLKMKFIFYEKTKSNYQIQYLIKKEKEFASLLIYKILDYKIRRSMQFGINRILEKVYKNNQMAIIVCSKAKNITQQKFAQNLCKALRALFQAKIKSSFTKLKEQSMQEFRTKNLIQLKVKEYLLKAAALSKTLKSLIKSKQSYSFQKMKQLQEKYEEKQIQNNIIQFEEKFDHVIKDQEAQIDMSIIKTQALANQEAENKLLRAKEKYIKTLTIIRRCRFLQIVSKYLQKRKQKCFIQFQNNTIIKMIQKMSKLKEQLMDKINDINLNLECQSEQERNDNWIIDYNKYLHLRRQEYQTAIQEAQVYLQNEEQDFLLTIQQMDQQLDQDPIETHIYQSEINPQTLQSFHNLSMQQNDLSIQNANNNLSSQNNIAINS